MTLLKTRPADHRALVWSFLAVPIQYWIATNLQDVCAVHPDLIFCGYRYGW
jgi:hypothetical protein